MLSCFSFGSILRFISRHLIIPIQFRYTNECRASNEERTLQNIYEALWSLKTNWSIEKLLKWDYAEGRYILARLDHGAEIISQISDIARDAKIEVGVFGVIGALSQAELSYYDQDSLQYGRILIEKPVELVSCSGNISEKDDRPFVHAHAVLAGQEGTVRGGHLSSGTIFAAELHCQELLGLPLKRDHDSITGLNLWNKSEDN